MNNYNLFLDDVRKVEDVKWNVLKVGEFNPVSFPSTSWEIVRNYNEFVSMVEQKGVPSIVAFDHDLGEEHYAALATDKRKHITAYDDFTEKTGYHCAKWLVDYCFQFNLNLPKEVYVHSMNPIGATKIRDLFECAIKFKS
jgi:hypothetical protein